jgi:hypothetical protein
MFRILQTGRTYIVDDYGWDLAGRNTIDLYMPTWGMMDRWGVQHVDIEVLQWGDPRESYDTLLSRSRYRHVQRMLRELRPELDSPEFAQLAPTQIIPTATPVARPVMPEERPQQAFQPFYQSYNQGNSAGATTAFYNNQ